MKIREKIPNLNKLTIYLKSDFRKYKREKRPTTDPNFIGKEKKFKLGFNITKKIIINNRKSKVCLLKGIIYLFCSNIPRIIIYKI